MKINRCISCQKETEHYPCPHCGFDGEHYQQPNYALPCGHILHGRYLMGRVLGQGGFGITYVGWDLVLQYKCAIKEFYPKGQAIRDRAMGTGLRWSEGVQAEEFRRSGIESFLREARKMHKVDHISQVVRVRDTFIENDTAYIVMDYVEGQTLKDRLEERGVLRWEEAESIFLPVIAAMAQVHEAGLVHRDLSPDNLMILPDGSVSILDLGAAKDLNTNSGASSMQVAKNGFSPIEQYTQRGGSGPWSDVYSIAATMYYSLTGKLPPTAIDRLEEDTIQWALPQLKALPKNVLTALQNAMEVTAAKRTRSMAELLEQMKSSVQKTGTHKKRKAGKKVTRIAAAVLIAAMLGGLAMWFRPVPEEAPQLAVPEETTAALETTIPAEPAETEHIHVWAPATVGRPARCSGCGLMKGTALPLTIGAWQAIVGVREDGSVIAQGGLLMEDQVSDWKDVESVASGYGVTYGVKRDGTVLVSGGRIQVADPREESKSNRRLAKDWTDIAAISVDEWHTVGLKKDGTAVAVGCDFGTGGDSYLHLEDWNDLVAVAAGTAQFLSPGVSLGSLHMRYPYSVGLKSDGTLVFAAELDLFPEARHWTDIVSIATDSGNLLGLKSDGTVVACWNERIENAGLRVSEEARARVEAWTDITQISCCFGIMGLKSDGTVVSENTLFDTSGWTDVAAVCAGYDYGLAVRHDGTVLGGEGMVGVDIVGRKKDANTWSGIRVPSAQDVSSRPIDWEHDHTWAEATISAPRHCTLCGIMEGYPLNNTIAAGRESSFAIRDDGTVTAVGSNIDGTLDIDAWQDIKSVAAGCITVGLKEDGTLVKAGSAGEWGSIQLGRIKDVVSIAVDGYTLVAVKANGTAEAMDWFFANGGVNAQAVAAWRDVLAVDLSEKHVVALKSDGTVVAVGDDDHGQCSGVQDWTAMVGVAAGSGITLGLKFDGTVSAIWDNLEGKAQVESWTDIIAIDAGNDFVVALKADGTVLTAGNCDASSWRDIAAISVSDHILGLKTDGTVAADSRGMFGGNSIEGTEAWAGIAMPR